MSANTYLSISPQPLVSEVVSPLVSRLLNASTELSAPVEKSSDVWNYAFHQYWQNEGCPHVQHLPLMGDGPLPVLLIMSGYLLFVTRLGPYLMRSRPAMELRNPMLVYNILMVVFNAYFFFKFIQHSAFGQTFLDFQFPNKYDNSPRAQALIQTSYLYFLTKFVDLLDTVFFVLRKKDRQVTILHLYHHTIVPVLCWLSVRLMPAIPAIQVFGILNSFVHVIMYSYYALSAFGPSIQPYLWWKKYITQVQITQFVIFIGYSLVLGKLQTGYPSTWFWIGFIQSPIFFYMFTDFYIQSYRKSKASRKML